MVSKPDGSLSATEVRSSGIAPGGSGFIDRFLLWEINGTSQCDVEKIAYER